MPLRQCPVCKAKVYSGVVNPRRELVLYPSSAACATLGVEQRHPLPVIYCASHDKVCRDLVRRVPQLRNLKDAQLLLIW